MENHFQVSVLISAMSFYIYLFFLNIWINDYNNIQQQHSLFFPSKLG